MPTTVSCEACLAVELCVKLFSASGALAAHVTVPLPYGRAARSHRKRQLSYYLLRSVAQNLPVHIGHKPVKMTDECEPPRSIPTVPTIKCQFLPRHALIDKFDDPADTIIIIP